MYVFCVSLILLYETSSIKPNMVEYIRLLTKQYLIWLRLAYGESLYEHISVKVVINI